MSWYLGVWKKFATFTGRARRTEYWMFFLFNLIVGFALGCVFQLKSHTIPVEIAQRSARNRTAFRRKSHTVPL